MQIKFHEMALNKPNYNIILEKENCQHHNFKQWT